MQTKTFDLGGQSVKIETGLLAKQSTASAVSYTHLTLPTTEAV